MVIQFEKGISGKMYMRRILSGLYEGDSSSSMHGAVVRSNFQPIIASFPINHDLLPNTSLIDVTSFIQADNELFSFNPLLKEKSAIADLQGDKSYIEDVFSFQENVEIQAVKTFKKKPEKSSGDVSPLLASAFISLQLNTSIILLPSIAMKQRFEDARVGYFALRQIDYDANPAGVKLRAYIKRWRLEPSATDADKFVEESLLNL
jgi:hypothetical protein